tara:strand:- start:143 stop:391 length:249 start_codon:yes stop_codon:yes gene_type:complete
MNIEIIRLDHGDSLPKTTKDDLLLIMGGPMGIKDIGGTKYPWQKKRKRFHKVRIKKRKHIIGVCLRAQLLGNAAGGDIEILK